MKYRVVQISKNYAKFQTNETDKDKNWKDHVDERGVTKTYTPEQAIKIVKELYESDKKKVTFEEKVVFEIGEI